VAISEEKCYSNGMLREHTIEELLGRGIEHIYPSVNVLRERLMEDTPLVIYLGIDPTGPTLHLGHAVVLQKLHLFQELGHKVILLIGDFTAQIGDPTGKSMARAPLTHEQVLGNARLYQMQAEKFLRFSGDNPAELKYNSEWLSKISFSELLQLASKITYAQLIKRDMFQERIAEGADIGLHEFLYPLMQGYDSVAMDVDGEIGGNDQTFNMLVGRDLAKKISGKEKIVVAVKLLTDSSGKKMGKSEGNMVSLSDNAREMFGKIMSWSDELILPGLELCTRVSSAEILEIEESLRAGVNPRDLKMRLAREIVSFYYTPETATAEENYFINTISNKETPTDVPELRFASDLPGTLVAAGLVSSKGEFRRLVDEGAVSFENEKITDPLWTPVKSGVLKVGKRRFVKLIVS